MTIDELYEKLKDKGVTRDGNKLSAGGDLYLRSLTTLPEGVTLSAGGDLDLGSLTTLPEGVTLSAGGYLDLGSLTTLPEGVTLSAGGYLDLRSLTTLPEGVTLSAKQVLGNLSQDWRGSALQSVDGIVMTLGEEHRAGAAVVRTARYFGRPAQSESVYVAWVGQHMAHGATVREAIEDATAKAGHASPAEVIAAIKGSGVITRTQYRALTGACREGVRQWCQSHGVADDVESLPVADVVRMTASHYGGGKLAALLQS